MLREAVQEHTSAGASIALDLSEVTFVDSTGLGAVVSSLEHVGEHGGTVAVIAPDETPLTRLLSLTGLDQVVRALPDRASLGAVA